MGQTRQFRARRVVAGATALLLIVAALAACSGTVEPSDPPPLLTTTPSPVDVSAHAGDAVSMTSPSAPTSAASNTSPGSDTSTPAPAVTSTPLGALDDADDISPEEAADRKAAEDAWLGFQTIMDDAWTRPSESWQPAISPYATDAAVERAIENLKSFVAEGKGNYGTVEHDLYWRAPVSNNDLAYLGDCMDESRAGTINAHTGEKLSVGVKYENTLVTLIRENTNWKVSEVVYTPNLACPGIDLTENEQIATLMAQQARKTS